MAPKCDVCNSPNVTTQVMVSPGKFSVLNSDSSVVMQEDDGDWKVCDACADMIRARDLKGLDQATFDANAAAADPDPDVKQYSRDYVSATHEYVLENLIDLRPL